MARQGGPGGGGGNGGGGGGGPGGGGGQGDLYGDLYVILRNLEDNGAPKLDPETGFLQYLDANGDPLPIDPDGEVPEGAQEVEFSRLSGIRSPDKVMDRALDEVLNVLDKDRDGVTDQDVSVTADVAGRLELNGVTIDSPLQNIALYNYIMNNPGGTALPDAYDNLDTAASLFGAAADKTIPITIDMLVYSNTILGLNPVDSEGNVQYYSFDGYNYSRAEKFSHDDGSAKMIFWYEDMNGDGALERQEATVLDAVFEGQDWVDWVDWVDGTDPNGTDRTPDPQHGIDDFVQAADDARAVIDFMHSMPLAGEVDPVTMTESVMAYGLGYGMAYGADGDCPLADGTCPLLV